MNFFRQDQISIFLHKSTQWDHRRLLHKFQKGIFFLLVSGFVLMRQYLLKISMTANARSREDPIRILFRSRLESYLLCRYILGSGAPGTNAVEASGAINGMKR